MSCSWPTIPRLNSQQENYLFFQSLIRKRQRQACLQGKAFEVLKIKEFTFVNDCFQDENNTAFGVILQRLINLFMMVIWFIGLPIELVYPVPLVLALVH